MILAKDEIGYILNPGVLLPGDILLMNTYQENLRKRMGCKYEHAAIYLGDAFIMEANGVFNVMTHIYSYAFRDKDDACVLRCKDISPLIRVNIARIARQKMAQEYINTIEFRKLRTLKNTEQKDTKKRSFCSRLVAQCYAKEKINLVHNADYCEPDDFLQSNRLEKVVNAIVPFTEDLTDVIMNNQKIRESEETESPGAELFKSLSKLYNEDIQELSQALMVALNHPDKADAAIEQIKLSGMFKHKKTLESKIPWIFDDDKFFGYYNDFEKGMHFLYSSMNHYDHSILPYYKELHCQLIITTYYFPNFKVGVFLRDYIKLMVDEAIECRKRFEDLYIEAFIRNEEASVAFCDKYGFYHDYEYCDKPIDISFILRDLMFAWDKKLKNSDITKK